MNPSCTICGCSDYDTFSFKAGQVCEDCLEYLKSEDDTVSEASSEE